MLAEHSRVPSHSRTLAVEIVTAGHNSTQRFLRCILVALQEGATPGQAGRREAARSQAATASVVAARLGQGPSAHRTARVAWLVCASSA